MTALDSVPRGSELLGSSVLVDGGHETEALSFGGLAVVLEPFEGGVVEILFDAVFDDLGVVVRVALGDDAGVPLD